MVADINRRGFFGTLLAGLAAVLGRPSTPPAPPSLPMSWYTEPFLPSWQRPPSPEDVVGYRFSVPHEGRISEFNRHPLDRIKFDPPIEIRIKFDPPIEIQAGDHIEVSDIGSNSVGVKINGVAVNPRVIKYG